MQSDFDKMPNDIHDFRQNNSSIRNVDYTYLTFL